VGDVGGEVEDVAGVVALGAVGGDDVAPAGDDDAPLGIGVGVLGALVLDGGVPEDDLLVGPLDEPAADGERFVVWKADVW